MAVRFILLAAGAEQPMDDMDSMDDMDDMDDMDGETEQPCPLSPGGRPLHPGWFR